MLFLTRFSSIFTLAVLCVVSCVLALDDGVYVIGYQDSLQPLALSLSDPAAQVMLTPGREDPSQQVSYLFPNVVDCRLPFK